MNNIQTILPDGCIRFGHKIYTFCLPKKGVCDNTVIDGIFVECGSQWNCNLICTGDSPYFMPVPSDGTIMLQTNFSALTSGGWGESIFIDLIDSNGVIVPGFDHTVIGNQWIVGQSPKHKYQTIEINIPAIEIECFGFKISTASQTICTQFYKKEICNNLVTIEGVFKNFDCWNNYYGDPVGEFIGDNFRYSNKIYIDGNAKYFGGNVDIEDSTIKEFTRFYPSKKIAGFMMKYILNKILASDKVIMNDIEYKNEGSGTFNPLPKSNMFFPTLEFYNECGGSSSGACE